MLKIAVVDVAAESGGALSVLEEFVDALIKSEECGNDEWYIITSVVKTKETGKIHNVRYPKIKKSWVHRLLWEYMMFPKFVKKYNIDVVFSLQNNALPIIKKTQVVYFHNVLLCQKQMKFSFIKKEERRYAICTKVLGPYIRRTWKWADKIITQSMSVKEQIQRYVERDKIAVCRPGLSIHEVIQADKKIEGYIYPAGAQIYKNFEAVICAAQKLEKENVNTKILLTINGDENNYAKKIKDMASGMKNIRFIGFLSRDELLKQYQKYGLIITSKIESFPIPILEAMRAGTVIVGMDRDYIREYYEQTGYNRLYLADNESELYLAMLNGLKDEKSSNYKMSDNNDGMEKMIEVIKEQKKVKSVVESRNF